MVEIAFAEGFDDFEFVFKGEGTQVDARTIARTLIGLSNAIREISRSIDPNTEYALNLVVLRDGSVIARLRPYIPKGALFAGTIAGSILVGVFSNVVYDKFFGSSIEVIVTTDEVVVQKGSDRIVIPRQVHIESQKAKESETLDKAICEIFNSLHFDPNIRAVEVRSGSSKQVNLISIPRDDFDKLRRPREFVPPESLPSEREILQANQEIIIRRVIFDNPQRLWEFSWNGFPISAPVKDEEFWEKVESRQFNFSKGDSMTVDLLVSQSLDETENVYQNVKYAVAKVHKLTHAPSQRSMPLEANVTNSGPKMRP